MSTFQEASLQLAPFTEALESMPGIHVTGVINAPIDVDPDYEDYFLFFNHKGHLEQMILGFQEGHEAFVLLMPDQSSLIINDVQEFICAISPVNVVDC